jgi:hypothetical protein
MVENNKVLLEKVDTLENIADSLTKSVSVVKFSWCTEAMGIVSLGLLTKVQEILSLAKKTRSERMLGCYILCSESRVEANQSIVKVEG